MKVFVYYNLHKKLFSIKSLEGETKGRVIAHRYHVKLRDVTFKVYESGRLRVLKEKRKNVHAGVIGEWIQDNQLLFNLGRSITYDPYKYSSFVYVDTLEPVYNMSKVLLTAKKIFEIVD